MREIDIHHLMNQLGIQPDQLHKWMSNQGNTAKVEGTRRAEHYLITPTPSSFISTPTRNSNSG
ncbi:hypothetical protein PAENIP36_46960 [Paenibacillus sp. P36]